MPAERFPELQQTLAGMRKLLYAQTRIVDLCLHHLLQYRDGNASLPANANRTVLEVVIAMIHVSGVSGHSILRLTEEIGLQARDGYPIARSVVESAINIAFVMAEGEPVASRAKRHAQQKSFRDLNRTSTIAGQTFTLGWSGQLDPIEIKRLTALAEEFSTKAGREKRDWIDRSVDDRIATVARRFGEQTSTLIHAAMLMVYRHASEILHGTYFAALFFWGVTRPGERPATADDLRVTMADHQFAVLCSTLLANTTMLECAGKYFSLPDIVKRSAEILDRLHKLPVLAGNAHAG
jgi:hypothetical protein